MKQGLLLRVWVLCLAGTAFLAGFAAGILRERGDDPPTGAFASYRVQLVREFELSPERERGLAALLDEYQRRLEEVESDGLEAFHGELVLLGDEYTARIRDFVLLPSQRERFDLMLGASIGGGPGGATF